MIDNRTTSAIDQALQKHHTPVGDLFAAIRHGRMKRCFSRDTAIRYLAYFLTSHAFACSGLKERHPYVRIERDDIEAWRRGEVTDEYHRAHQRTVRRLRRILARKREALVWQKKYDAWVAQREVLMKQRPF